MNISFENSVVRLEAIITELEKGDISLEESIKLFKEGAELSALCYSKLQKAEQKITEISKKTIEGNESDE